LADAGESGKGAAAAARPDEGRMIEMVASLVALSSRSRLFMYVSVLLTTCHESCRYFLILPEVPEGLLHVVIA
jgi:hypothetical protein